MCPRSTSVLIADVTASGLSLADFRFLGKVDVMEPANMMWNPQVNPWIKNCTKASSGWLARYCFSIPTLIGVMIDEGSGRDLSVSAMLFAVVALVTFGALVNKFAVRVNAASFLVPVHADS